MGSVTRPSSSDLSVQFLDIHTPKKSDKMARALIYLLLVAGSHARGTGLVEGEEAPVAKDVEKAADGVSVNDRKGKFFSVFQIVKFQNGKCTTSTGDDGTCYTEAECMAAGGEPSGACASSFGVCCLCK